MNSEKEKRDELKFFYEKAIHARDQLYDQYIRYMGQYAIFDGALFIALYSLIGNNGSDDLHYCLMLIISWLGLLTSILWLCSAKGYYLWLINFIKIVQYYEVELNKGEKIPNVHFVYKLFHDASGRHLNVLSPQNYSTQKLTIGFIFATLIGWILILIRLYSNCGCFTNILVCGVVVLVVVVLFVSVKDRCCSLSSDISEHFRLEGSSEHKQESIIEQIQTIRLPQKEKKNEK